VTVQSSFAVGVHPGLRVDDSRTHPGVPQHGPFSAFSPAKRWNLTNLSSFKASSDSLSDVTGLERYLLVVEKGSRTSDQQRHQRPASKGKSLVDRGPDRHRSTHSGGSWVCPLARPAGAHQFRRGSCFRAEFAFRGPLSRGRSGAGFGWISAPAVFSQEAEFQGTSDVRMTCVGNSSG